MRNNYHSEQLTKLKEFGLHVRALRQGKELSQDKLAELACLNRNYLGEVERGERNISLLNLIQLAQGLGVSMQEIFPQNM